MVRAEELANGLTKYPIAGIQKVMKVSPENFSKDLAGKEALSFLKIIGGELTMVKRKALGTGAVITLTCGTDQDLLIGLSGLEFTVDFHGREDSRTTPSQERYGSGG